MSDITPNPQIPAMPMELFTNAMPVINPQMDWSQGLISGFVHEAKTQQRARVATLEADISEAKERNSSAVLRMMQNFMTYSTETDLRFKRADHEKEKLAHEKYLWGIEKENAVIARDTGQANLVNLQLKNMLLKTEVEISAVDLKGRLKEMEAMYGGPESA